MRECGMMLDGLDVLLTYVCGSMYVCMVDLYMYVCGYHIITLKPTFYLQPLVGEMVAEGMDTEILQATQQQVCIAGETWIGAVVSGVA